jgi:hypothetical protein
MLHELPRYSVLDYILLRHYGYIHSTELNSHYHHSLRATHKPQNQLLQYTLCLQLIDCAGDPWLPANPDLTRDLTPS